MRILKRETERLLVELTQPEFNAKAKDLAEKHEQLAILREVQKERKAEMKLELEAIEQERTELARVVQRRAEERDVEVEMHADDARGVLSYVRMDTGEVYRERPMGAGERQLDAFPEPSALDNTTVSFESGGRTVEMTGKQFDKAVKAIATAPLKH